MKNRIRRGYNCMANPPPFANVDLIAALVQISVSMFGNRRVKCHVSPYAVSFNPRHEVTLIMISSLC